MAMIGVLARVDLESRAQTIDSLCELDGVDVFSVDQQEQIGILIEHPAMSHARQTLFDQVEAIPGVLCAWPVYSHLEQE